MVLIYRFLVFSERRDIQAPQYATQIKHVATRLPKLPKDLDVWQIFTPGSNNKIYKVPINIDHVVKALEWLRVNNPLCTVMLMF